MATQTKQWTLDEVHSLPDDGNKYELVRGELFVTPPPSTDHETILARLSRILSRFVDDHDLGMVFHPRAVVQHDGSEVEPDLIVRRPGEPKAPWAQLPVPSLVVEVTSPVTRRRDRHQKRTFYMESGVGEYWIVDPDARTITVVRYGAPDGVVSQSVAWHPAGAPNALEIGLDDVFGG